MDKTTEPDNYGGVITEWKEGAEIKAAFVLDNSLQARMADKQGVKDVYSIVTEKNVILRFHDVVYRDSEKAFYRATSNGDDKKTPKSAGLNMRVVTAERLEKL